MIEASAAITDRLARFVDAHVDDLWPRVGRLHRIGVGRSRENWVFDLVTERGGTEPLILRRDPVGGLLETDRRVEFSLLKALEKSDLPTPYARWLDADGTWFGRPSLIMRRAPGECDYHVLGGDRPLAWRRNLAQQLCDLLAAVHAVDWRRLSIGDFLPDPGMAAAQYELNRWEGVLRRDQLEDCPELELALGWLRATVPAASRTVLVHGDFKPGNVLLENGRITALLDWELAHLGDPLEDLGWVTQPLRAREHTIARVWSIEDLIARYEHTTGAQVDRASLGWWTAFAAFKTAVMQVSGLRSFLDGRSEEPFRPTRAVLSTLLAAVGEGRC